VDYRAVSNGYTGADNARRILVAMNNGSVLDIGIFSDLDGRDIASNRRGKPDRRTFVQRNSSGDFCRPGYEY